MRTFPLVASLSLCFLLVACGGAGMNVDTNGEMHVSDSEGSVTIGASIPADWPTDVPVIPESTVTLSGSGNEQAGKQASMVVLDTAKTPQEVQTYYTAELKKQGWVVQGTVQMGGSTIIAASKGKRALSLQIAAGAAGKTSVTLAVGEQ